MGLPDLRLFLTHFSDQRSFKLMRLRKQIIKQNQQLVLIKVNTNHQGQEQILSCTVLLLMFKLPVGADRMIIKNQLRQPKRVVDIRLRMTNFLYLAPSSFVIISYPYLLTHTEKNFYSEILSICLTTLTIWMILSAEVSMK